MKLLSLDPKNTVYFSSILVTPILILLALNSDIYLTISSPQEPRKRIMFIERIVTYTGYTKNGQSDAYLDTPTSAFVSPYSTMLATPTEKNHESGRASRDAATSSNSDLQEGSQKSAHVLIKTDQRMEAASVEKKEGRESRKRKHEADEE